MILSLLVPIVSFIFNTNFVLDNLKNWEIILNYQFFEKYMNLDTAKFFIQPYYQQNLQSIAKIKLKWECSRKVFKVKTKNIFKRYSTIFNYYLRCWLEKKKHYISAKIITNTVYFRVHNIKVALKNLNWKVWKLWEKFDTVEFLKKYKNDYIAWQAIYNWKIVMIRWWGLCWFATILYQLALKSSDFKVLERYPHTLFYEHYYNFTGLDAAVFFHNWIVKNLIIENNHADWFFKTYWQQTKKSFIYEVRFYSIKPFVLNKIRIGEIYRIKDKNCVNVWIGNAVSQNKIVSCYKGVFQ